jgi:5-methylcytosine-specific restriction endonuclease McrA
MIAMCQICGDSWTRDTRGGPSPGCPNCALKLRRRAANERHERDLCECGSAKQQKSLRCEPCAKKAIRIPERWATVNCLTCGATINRSKHRNLQIYCSSKCFGATRRKPDSKLRLAKRRAAKSHARRLKAAQGRKVLGRWRAIGDRDHWQCWLCDGVIDPTLLPPHRLSGSVDHVVPLSRGGSDADDNVRIAHFTCNVRRSNGSLTKLGMPAGVVSPEVSVGV